MSYSSETYYSRPWSIRTRYATSSNNLSSSLGSSENVSYGASSSRYVSGGASSSYGASSYGASNAAITTGEYSSSANSDSVSQIAQDLLTLSRNTTSSAPAEVNYTSAVETSIVKSSVPINVSETEEITVNGQRGLWTNKAEVVNWRGPMAISQYEINQDSNPEIITKRVNENLVYTQEIAIRYLRPPKPPTPGDIIITQEPNKVIPAAPPIVIRQLPPRPVTPPPVVIREAPPQQPPQIPTKHISIAGRTIPPPPRKVVIERLPQLPNKPPSILIERWLPYEKVKRRVIFRKNNQIDPIVVKPRNLIIQWEAPQVTIEKDFKFLGVVDADPEEYVRKYGSTLKIASQLPQFVLDIPTPNGIRLAANTQINYQLLELEGDVSALALVDLDKEDLGYYKSYLQRLGINSSLTYRVNDVATSFEYNGGSNSNYLISSDQSYSYSEGASYSTSSVNNSIIEDIFSTIDRSNDGRISIEEAEKVFLKLNSRLGRRYGETDVRSFFRKLDIDNNSYIDLEEFKLAFRDLL